MSSKTAEEADQAHEKRRRRRALLALGLAALVVAAIRLRIADVPLERDEGEYAYFAQLLLQGVPPWAEAYTMKMPGTAAAYALALGLFGQTALAIRLGLLVVSLLSMVLVYALGRRIGDEWTGAAAGTAYGFLSLAVAVLGTAAHATHFVALFALAGLLWLLRALESGRNWQLAASGAVLGLAYTMKQHGVVFAAFGVVWVFRHSRRGLVAYCAGAALPFAAIALWLWAAGVFERFWFWNFVYASSYATSEPFSYALGRPLAGFLALAALGLLAPIGDERARRSALFLGGLLVASVFAVVPGGHFRPHYFIALWPAVALLAGVGATALARRVSAKAAAALVVASAALLIGMERDPLLRLSPLEFSREVYRLNPFPESIEIADYVRANTAPDERVAVFGSEPQIFFYAQRRSATGHIYMYGLTEVHPYALAMQKELVAQVEAARAPVVVLANAFSSWMWRPASEHHAFDWAQGYLQREYDVAGVVEITDSGTTYVWGEAARSYAPRTDESLVIFRRKPPASEAR